MDRAHIETFSEIDWTQCELIEQIPGKVSGRPIVRGTRILPDAILNSHDAGGTLEDIHEDYPGLSIPQSSGSLNLLTSDVVRRGPERSRPSQPPEEEPQPKG